MRIRRISILYTLEVFNYTGLVIRIDRAMPQLTTHFWVGKFESKKLYEDFFEERKNRSASTYISKFAKSQKEKWIDHDFLESGFNNKQISFLKKLEGHSYWEYWSAELESRIKQIGIKDFNVFVMSSLDRDRTQVKEPRSFEGEGISLFYIGTITYEYKHPDWFQKILDGE